MPSHKNTPSLAWRFTFTRHDEGCNYTFADGHVKWLQCSQARQGMLWHWNH